MLHVYEFAIFIVKCHALLCIFVFIHFQFNSSTVNMCLLLKNRFMKLTTVVNNDYGFL